MMNTRRALLLSTGERYFGMLCSFAALAIVSRVLSAEEIGLMALGMAISNLVETSRELGATAFIIQEQTASRETPRSAFTLVALLTLLIAVPLLIFAPSIANVYGEPRLAPLISVLAFSFLPGPFSAIPFAIMHREMSFATPAIIAMAGAFTSALGAIVLALNGASYMSSAYAMLACNVVVAALTVFARPDLLWTFRPTLQRLRGTLTFGGHSAIAGVLIALNEFLPNIILGRILNFDSLGYFNRAYIVCTLPDKLLLNGASPVVLPAFSALARGGYDIKAAYLNGLKYLCALKCPVQIILAILAEPIVRLLLGAKWIAIVPIVQIMALAAIIRFPFILTSPVLVTCGAINLYVRSLLIAWPLATMVMIGSAFYGLTALAWSFFLVSALYTIPGIFYVRKVIGFTWTEVARALRTSVIVTIASTAAPVAIFFSLDHVGYWAAAGITLLAAAGWLVALRLTRHPLLGEVNSVIDLALRMPLGDQLRKAVPARLRAAFTVSAGRPQRRD